MKAESSAIGVSQYKNKEFMVTGWLRIQARAAGAELASTGVGRFAGSLPLRNVPKEGAWASLLRAFLTEGGRTLTDGKQSRRDADQDLLESDLLRFAIFPNGIRDLHVSSQAREDSVVWPGLRQSPSVNKCARPHA